jgi:3-oxoacyl-[acyl-carrier-protein] synthase II
MMEDGFAGSPRALTPRRTPGVVVTGLGATTPLGGDVLSTWTALLAGESGVSALPDEWAASLPARIAGRLRKDCVSALGRLEARRLDRSQQVALVAARQAWQDAGTPDVEPERFAVVFGTGIGGALTMLGQDDVIEARGPGMISPYTIPMIMPNGSAAVISLDLGARGGAHAPMSACASGAEAIAVGAALIRSGRVDVVVAGGAEACLHPLSMAGFSKMGALSRRNDDPEGASRPFDSTRDGFVMAEGAGAVVLERANFARARKATSYAVLAGTDVTSDAHDMTTPHRPGQVRALRAALRMADLAPTDITHVNVHATGTRLGDQIEAQSIQEAIGTHPVVAATKSQTGHLIGGSGAVEAIFTILAMRDGVVPATRNLTEQDTGVPLDLVTGRPRATPVHAALSNSFGFGGHNVVLLFRKSA